ncbi:MAG: cation:proton antiporter [Treponema sp.]|nr:cation:proton antiporter [Treponema sp.]
MHTTGLVAQLVLQIGLILFAIRLFGFLAKKIKAPSVLGELLAGAVIGPFALGGISLPLFPDGIFPISDLSGLAVSVELYAFATVASVVLLFACGLETNLGLFLRYSVAGGIIGISGAILSFITGTFCGALLFDASFLDPRSLFLGVIATTTSVGISARTLSERKRMDSPEGVTILTAAVFDDVVWIVLLAVVLGIVSVVSGDSGTVLSVGAIFLLAGRIFGIWLGVTALFIICAKIIARFLKLFKHSLDFSVLSLGIAMVLAGLLERQGFALIIGAYIAGLSLSRTDIAAVIQERIRPLYEFFVPIFFAVMGMMVNVREVASLPVLIFAGAYTLAVILSKVIGAGGPALLFGFNRLGALRIGFGMIPRGEGALITCGIGLAAGVLNNQLFAAAVFMIFLTIVISQPLLGFILKKPRQGTRKPVKNDDIIHEVWEFESDDIADVVMNMLLQELRTGKYYVQRMTRSESYSAQVRKNDISITITEEKNSVVITTSKTDMPFIKNAMYEVILDLSHSIEKLIQSAIPKELKKELLDTEARTSKDLLALIDIQCFNMELKGETKAEIISELVDIIEAKGKVTDRELVLADVLRREETMSTGMEYGIALPHGKTDGITETTVAIGIKKSGVNFDCSDGMPARLFILIVSPKKSSGLHVQFLAAIGAILGDDDFRESVINAASPQEAVDLLTRKRG